LVFFAKLRGAVRNFVQKVTLLLEILLAKILTANLPA
jgi:hypothetical protein